MLISANLRSLLLVVVLSTTLFVGTLSEHAEVAASAPLATTASIATPSKPIVASQYSNPASNDPSSPPTQVYVPPPPSATVAAPTRAHVSGPDSPRQFLADLDGLKTLNGSIPVLTPTHSSRDSSYTKTWKNEDWDKYQLEAFARYHTHLRSWPRSPTAKAVVPAVLTFVLWSLLISLITSHIPIISNFITKSSFSVGISSFSSPIALLLALRTNRALNRLLEARSMFGIMARASGSLAGLTTTYAYKVDKEKTLLLSRYLSIFGWAMKSILRDEDDQMVYRTVLPQSEIDWIEGNTVDTPTCIILRIRQLVSTMIEDIPLAASSAMEARISDLEVTMGVCKRLLGSPIPPTYTRHTSRVLCLFLGLLPLALVSAKVSPMAIVIIVALLGYVFVGIDEIGVEIENPFPLLPMYHLASTIQRNVVNQVFMMDQQQQQQQQQQTKVPQF